MSTPKDGGPAFPTYQQPQPEMSFLLANPGLSLRDLFAAQALPQLVRTALDMDHKAWEATAAHAYIIADAMLAERNK